MWAAAMGRHPFDGGFNASARSMTQRRRGLSLLRFLFGPEVNAHNGVNVRNCSGVNQGERPQQCLFRRLEQDLECSGSEPPPSSLSDLGGGFLPFG
jgi:hypothetical protein